jgi:GH43 family beta-xylosidase
MTELIPLRILLALALALIACRDDTPGKTDTQQSENTFTNPLLSSAPDPWVIQKDGSYYFTHTTGNSIKLYRTQEMSELPEAEVRTIWSPPASGMNSESIWAPEIQYINNKWYFYYAADDGKNENHRMWALVNEAADPFTGSWTDAGKLQLPNDKWAIDGSAFEHNGQLYFLWSGWEGDTNVKQNIYIVKMKDALTPEGDRIMLSTPELPWELAGSSPTVNEAPQFFSHGGKVFIAYSASGCWTDEYALGLLTADANADLLSPASWKKSPTPVFIKSADSETYGPGHITIFKSPDGSEDWFMYHANAASGQGCGGHRSTRMQKIAWRSDGTPDFGTPAALGKKLLKPSGDD